MKKNFWIWIAFLTLLSLLSALLFKSFNALLSLPAANAWKVAGPRIAFGISVAFFAGILIKAIYDGWVIIRQQWELIVEIGGKYIGRPLSSGIHLFFPWFGLVNLRCATYKGTQMMELCLDDKIDSDYGGGNIQFKDCSSGIKAYFYFKIADSNLSTYATEDLFEAMSKKVDGLLRSFFGLYSLEEAIRMRNLFSLETVAALTNFCSDNVSTEEEWKNLKTVAQDEWQASEFFVTLTSWGIEPVNLVISNIELTPELEKTRQVILTAEKAKDVAKIRQGQAEIDKGTTVIEATADKEAAILRGEGRAAQIKQVTDAGIPLAQLVEFEVNTKKWDAIKESKSTDKVILLESSDSTVSQSAKLGAGLNLLNDKKSGKDEDNRKKDSAD